MSRLLESLRETYEIIDAAIAKAAEDSRSSQGMASLIKQRVDVAIKLDEEQRRIDAEERGGSDDELDDADLIALQVADLSALPDPLLDAILRGVAAERPDAIARLTVPRLEIVGGRDT